MQIVKIKILRLATRHLVLGKGCLEYQTVLSVAIKNFWNLVLEGKKFMHTVVKLDTQTYNAFNMHQDNIAFESVLALKQVLLFFHCYGHQYL